MGLDHSGRAGITDSPPQQPHESINRVLFYFSTLAPNRVDNRGAWDHPPLIANQKFEEPKFSEGDPNLFPIAESTKGVGLEQQVPALKNVFCLRGTASRQRTHSRQEFLE